MKNKHNNGGIVYSTDPNYVPDDEIIEPETIEPKRQKLRVSLDKKSRGGKQVTLITGFIGRQEDLDALCKTLKTACGVGGSAKNGEMIIQGDFRQKITQLLLDRGFSNTKISGI